MIGETRFPLDRAEGRSFLSCVFEVAKVPSWFSLVVGSLLWWRGAPSQVTVIVAASILLKSRAKASLSRFPSHKRGVTLVVVGLTLGLTLVILISSLSSIVCPTCPALVRRWRKFRDMGEPYKVRDIHSFPETTSIATIFVIRTLQR
ncbi:unnamed protein product [Brassica oleracea]